MVTYIIGGALLLACGLAVYRYLYRLRRGDSCCTIGEEPTKKVQVADRNKIHYSHEASLSIDGMVCANCALQVENALNSLPGTWASVDLGRRTAMVRGKEPLDYDRLRQAVRQSGYIVTDVRPI